MFQGFTMLSVLLTALPVYQAAVCHGGCSGHGSCGLLGTCICEGSWAGRDCSFQLSLDAALPDVESSPVPSASKTMVAESTDASMQFLSQEDQGQASASPAFSVASERTFHDQMGIEGLQRPVRSGALAFAQARRAARDAWAAADRLFAAAKQENTRDADERVRRAIERARSQKGFIPGHEFAGMQAPAAVSQAHKQLCVSDCSNQGLCIAGKCMCNASYHGPSCEHRRCLNDCSGKGACFQGRCQCSPNFEGEDCSRELASTPSSFASMLSVGLAAEKEELERQQSHSQKVEKACALNCDGRGSCRDGVCECRDGWSGPACQDYMELNPVTLEQATEKSCSDPLCSGNGICQSGICKCSDGFSGEACKLGSAVETEFGQPLQLQLQQVTEEDKRAALCLGGCGDRGSCKAGMCECQPGWQGTNCAISAEAAIRGPAASSDEEEQDFRQQLASVPTAASWIASEARSTRALRVPGKAQDLRSASLLTSSAITRQELNPTAHSSSVGTAAATALHSLFSSAMVSEGHPVNGLAALLKAAIAAPED